ncbi:alpha/beta hydrolase family protein [Pontibacillus halophilus]|uniref:alpha/beta hydrolase family protein n=1 Tax=Pontibacillus halophilus TaxID=516704 RepID=UPI0004289B92|nr:prolyl oligopeptidase family serine peptidase [Pontibacillus halophilus]
MKNGTIVHSQRYPSPHPQMEVELVTYISDGLKVKGFLVKPKGEGEYPGFLYLRGGIKNVGRVRIGRLIQFASEGFVVFAPCYRGNLGGEGAEDFALADRQDATSGMMVLQQLPYVTDELYAFGFSRGGVMALWVAIEHPGVKKVVTWGGVSDVSLTYWEREDLRRMLKRVVGGSPNKYPERYEARTPLSRLEELAAPVLIIHGYYDVNVSVEHARTLETRLQEVGTPVSSWVYYDLDHYFPPAINRKTVKRLCQWLRE